MRKLFESILDRIIPYLTQAKACLVSAKHSTELAGEMLERCKKQEKQIKALQAQLRSPHTEENLVWPRTCVFMAAGKTVTIKTNRIVFGEDIPNRIWINLAAAGIPGRRERVYQLDSTSGRESMVGNGDPTVVYYAECRSFPPVLYGGDLHIDWVKDGCVWIK